MRRSGKSQPTPTLAQRRNWVPPSSAVPFPVEIVQPSLGPSVADHFLLAAAQETSKGAAARDEVLPSP
eukprot:4802419-Amphidinium_carterae.1